MLKSQILVATISMFLWMLCVPSLSAACREEMVGGQSVDQAAEQALAAIPLPKITAEQALPIANAELALETTKKKSEPPVGWTIVAIEWCKSSNFQPSVATYGSYTVLDDREAYAWFVTYLGPKHAPPFDESGPKSVPSVYIIRIKDNRKADGLIGTRT
jgi:hypothetical protein